MVFLVVFLATGYSALWCTTVPHLHYTCTVRIQPVVSDLCTLPLPGRRPGVQSALWSCHMHVSVLPMCSPLPGHGGEVLESGTVSQVPAGYLGQERRAKWNGASGMAAGSRRSCRPTAFWRTRHWHTKARAHVRWPLQSALGLQIANKLAFFVLHDEILESNLPVACFKLSGPYW